MIMSYFCDEVSIPTMLMKKTWFRVPPQMLRDYLSLCYSSSLPWGCHEMCQLVSLFVVGGTSLAARKWSVIGIIWAIEQHQMVTSSDKHNLLTLESCTWNWKYRHWFANPQRHL